MLTLSPLKKLAVTIMRMSAASPAPAQPDRRLGERQGRGLSQIAGPGSAGIAGAELIADPDRLGQLELVLPGAR